MRIIEVNIIRDQRPYITLLRTLIVKSNFKFQSEITEKFLIFSQLFSRTVGK